MKKLLLMFVFGLSFLCVNLYGEVVENLPEPEETFREDFYDEDVLENKLAFDGNYLGFGLSYFGFCPSIVFTHRENRFQFDSSLGFSCPNFVEQVSEGHLSFFMLNPKIDAGFVLFPKNQVFNMLIGGFVALPIMCSFAGEPVVLAFPAIGPTLSLIFKINSFIELSTSAYAAIPINLYFFIFYAATNQYSVDLSVKFRLPD